MARVQARFRFGVCAAPSLRVASKAGAYVERWTRPKLSGWESDVYFERDCSLGYEELE